MEGLCFDKIESSNEGPESAPKPVTNLGIVDCRSRLALAEVDFRDVMIARAGVEARLRKQHDSG